MSDIKTALQAEIEKMESACDEIPFGLDEEDEQCLWVMREVIKQLAQREAQIAALETTLEREREKSRRVMSQLAELAKQEVSGWRAVENDNRDLREPLYLDGFNEPAGWSSDYEPLYARAAPPAPVVPDAIDNTAQQYEALAGWKMVPVEPSKEMRSQIHPIADGNCSHCGIRTTLDCEENMLLSWRDMLEAAPKPEA